MSISKRYCPEIGSKTCRNCGNVRRDHTETGTTLACPESMPEPTIVEYVPHPVDVAHGQLLTFLDLCVITRTPITRGRLMNIPHVTGMMVDAALDGMRLHYTGGSDGYEELYFQVDHKYTT